MKHSSEDTVVEEDDGASHTDIVLQKVVMANEAKEQTSTGGIPRFVMFPNMAHRGETRPRYSINGCINNAAGGGPSTKRTCSHEGCGKQVRKGHLSCARHGGPNIYCIVEGCTKVSQKRGHCTRCWNKKHTSKGNKSVVVCNKDQAALALCNLANGGNTHTRSDEPGRKRTYQEVARLSCGRGACGALNP